MHGYLEMIWRDTSPEAGALKSRFSANLVTSDNRRIKLDPDSLRASVPDIHRLQGRYIALTPGNDAASLKALSEGGNVPLKVAAITSEAPLASTPPVVGSHPWASILCKYADKATEPKSPAYFEGLFSDVPGRIGDFWRTVSYGKLDVAGSKVTPTWLTLPHPREHYSTKDLSGFETADLDALFKDCTKAAQGVLDIDDFVGIHLMFNDEVELSDIGAVALGGRWGLIRDGRWHTWQVTWEPPWGYANAAPLAHEMGHGLGLPHANNSDGDSDPYDNPWDVMSDAWSNAIVNLTYGYIPKHLNTYHRDVLGWVDPARKLTIDSHGDHPRIALDFASLANATNPQLIIVTLPGEPATHYYTLEARQRSGLFDGGLAGTAVIIHEVDTTRNEPSWSVDATSPPADVSNNRGSMFRKGDRWEAPNSAFSLTVDSATTTGFVVSIKRAEGTARTTVELNQHGLSGSWADSSTPGQGIVLGIDPSFYDAGTGLLFAGWYAYDATAAGGQRWYTLQGQVKADAPSAKVSIYLTKGGSFASAQGTSTTPVGEATLEFRDCMHGTLKYQFSDGRSGSVPLSRLTTNITCGQNGNNGSVPSTYLLSGPWADLSQHGQGFVFDINSTNSPPSLFAGWYTFDANGQTGSSAATQRWYTLEATLVTGTSLVNSVGIYETTGGAFNQGTPTRTKQVGDGELVYASCSSATFTYRFTAGSNSGKSGTMTLARLGAVPRGCTI